MLPITSIYVGLLTFIFLALSYRVIFFRRANRVSLGDADSKDLRQRVRGQGNFTEYAPIGLIILACVELQGSPTIAVHLLGLMLFAGRLLHAMAFWVHPMNFRYRTWGMILTTAMMAFGGLGLVLHSLL
jgi:uncharacterized membrane protein YecN with MAPEG domain